jgi:hypothetical protein
MGKKMTGKMFWLTAIRCLDYFAHAPIVSGYTVAKTIASSRDRTTVLTWEESEEKEDTRMVSRVKLAQRLRRIIPAMALLPAFLFSVPGVRAQVDEGSITGTVQDNTGAIVPNAKVTLNNLDQGIALQGETTASGEYVFSPVRIGRYSLTIEAPGFSRTTQSNLTVNVGQRLQVNVSLKLGNVAETVEVTTAPPQLQTDDSSVGQVVTEQSVNSLPLNGRNFTFLAQLGAGTQTPQADTRGNANSGAFSANGLRPAQNNYLLDGIDNNSDAVDFLNGTNYVVLPPVDAISEFKVQTADFSAEVGRAAGAVLNATIKTGTNQIHGTVWEFFRNDKLDAADWFEDNAGIKKGELRQNQFGASIGGPILKDKIFYFGDYEGFRRVQGTVLQGTVPTAAEVASGFTNLGDILASKPYILPPGSGQPTPTAPTVNVQQDALGRYVPYGTVLDPATTRSVTAGTVDPTSGLTAASTGFVRDPFGNCPINSSTGFTTGSCTLNQLPAGRIDPVALKLLSLYPKPTQAGVSGNYTNSPKLFEHKNSFDTRVDVNPTQKDQVFLRFSYVDDPDFIPGIFGGVADGGGFQQGDQSAKASQTAFGYTHVFTPTTINVVHAGFNHLHTTRYGPAGTQTGVPAQYGIQGIPQFAENGGLPTISIGGLSTLGSNAYLPSDEVSQTLQLTDDFTKILGKHSFKAGFETQFLKFSVLQPPYSRGSFDFSGTYTDVPSGSGGTTTGRAQFLLTPEAATVANGVSYSGGSDQVQASNASKTYDSRKYFAGYLQDDWKASPHLTLNLGVRYDYFGPINETNGGQANFVPSGAPYNAPAYILPASGKDNRTLSPAFVALLQKDGIAVQSTNRFGQGLVVAQKYNLSPRIGFAYQATPKFVIRGGYGIFFNAFESQGYGPNIGENYPFQFGFNLLPQSTTGTQTVAPVSVGTPFSGCATAGPGGTATLASGLTCVQLTPTGVTPQGLNLEGLQFNFQTPRTQSANLTVQYSLTRALSAQVAYVFTGSEHLQAGIGNNNVTQILAANANPTSAIPFPDFARNGSFQATIGQSNYNGLQMKLEQQMSHGLTLLVAYTYSKSLGDAADLLNGGSLGAYRAPAIPGFGPSFDYGPTASDIRNVFHLSGGYELPMGRGKAFLNHSGKFENALFGGYSINFITTLQGGQPITLNCPVTTAAGTNCDDILVPGQSPKLGLHTDSNGKLSFFGNPAAFQQPCPIGITPPAGCIPETGRAVLGGGPATTSGPGFHRLDFSLFKDFKFNGRISAQFRTEFFNILNHPNFNAPGFGGNGVVAISNSTNFTSSNFGEIGSTRDAPYDPRQIQFAFKLYY